MNIENIKNLDLTIEDFKLLNKALESLPHADMAGELIGTMMEGILMDKGDPEAIKELQKRKFIEHQQKEREREILTEGIRILQGKLLSLKRVLIENNLMDQLK